MHTHRETVCRACYCGRLTPPPLTFEQVRSYIKPTYVNIAPPSPITHTHTLSLSLSLSLHTHQPIESISLSTTRKIKEKEGKPQAARGSQWLRCRRQKAVLGPGIIRPWLAHTHTHTHTLRRWVITSTTPSLRAPFPRRRQTKTRAGMKTTSLSARDCCKCATSPQRGWVFVLPSLITVPHYSGNFELTHHQFQCV